MTTFSSARRRGSAMLTILGVIFVAGMILGTVATVGAQRSFTTRKLSDRVRALAYAEAGANQAYYILANDWSQRTNANAFPLTAYGRGSYDATVTAISNNLAIIESRGVCNGVEVSVMLDIRNYGAGESPGSSFDMSAFDYAIVCEGTAYLRGCGILEGTNGPAKLHSNGKFDVRGNVSANLHISSSTQIASGNVTINGSTMAPSYALHQKAKVTGDRITGTVARVSIPDIDLTPYYNWAQAHGEVKNGFSTSSSYTPNGGILWVNGDVQISSWATINGTIIATGDIKVSGQVTVNASSYGFALVSRDGSIDNTSSGTITGLIYCKSGDYKHTANGRTEGQIVVKGNIDKGGNSDVLVYNKIVPTIPGDTDPTPGNDLIAVSAWQK